MLGRSHKNDMGYTKNYAEKKMNRSILVTGGAGFIGSNFIEYSHAAEETGVINLDKVTYAGNPKNLDSLTNSDKYFFVQGDINDASLVNDILNSHQPNAIVHFAAESHVDRSINEPGVFIHTNVNGTLTLLECARRYWSSLSAMKKSDFRFLHVSTDEVYGSLSSRDHPFTENSGYAPNSPYSASKAASDHLVRAYHHTFGLPTLISHCSNNYGPYQFPEKLIPLMILNALEQKPLPVYGNGQNIRDWLYVTDHCKAIWIILKYGRVGDVYNIGGTNELKNIDVVRIICGILDELKPAAKPYADLINYVTDRPGHDQRYAIDIGKIHKELGWEPKESFTSGIRKTINWYLNNPDWVKDVQTGTYKHWLAVNYGERVIR